MRAESVGRDQTVYHKDLLPVVYVVGDMTGKLDSPLYGMFDIRGRVMGKALPQGGTLGEYFISQPEDAYAGYAVKWDGEWQVTYEIFRDMGLAYTVGLILIYLLVVAQFKSYLVRPARSPSCLPALRRYWAPFSFSTTRFSTAWRYR